MEGKAMAERDDLLASIAATTADYREGDLAAPTPAHVEKWVNQFDAAVQVPILREMDHVLKKTYFSRQRTVGFLAGLFQTEKLVGPDPCAFWKNVKFLNIQKGGASQTQMLALFSKILKTKCGFEAAACGSNPSVYVYIDDATFTGNRVKQDLESWVIKDAPNSATVHVILIALHSGARYYAEHHHKGNILKSASDAGKNIDFHWWCAEELENQKAHTNTSDVLRPVRIPDDKTVQEYVDSMTHKPHLRTAGHVGGKGLFTSDEGRQLLEDEFLKAGTRIRKACPNLNKYQRPLGNMLLETLGFGSLIVTFRNCPNNAPLALWAGDPWYPLFPRVTNSDTAMKRFMAMLAKDVF
ncbi:MAG: hypothetical protein OQJ98_02855 [Candidatus Pacebacteria bacterium]|nr:hypothetical protein [Candidatus Paceibacterota bacterium]